MRILITGASGFIGARLAARLAGEGHELFVLPSPRFGGRRHRLAGVPYTVVSEAGAARAELVYHLAGPPMDAAESELERVIVGGAQRLAAELAAAPPRRLVIAGSGAEYGSGHRWQEDDADAARPDTALGAFKRVAAGILRNAGFASVVLRLFTPYGEGEAPTRLIPSAARAALAGETIRLRSTGTQTRDYVHINDVVDAFAVAGTGRPLEPGIAINIASGKARRAADVARLVAELAGTGAAVEPGPAEPAELRESSGHPGRASALLGWQAHTSLHEGIRLTLASMRNTQMQLEKVTA